LSFHFERCPRSKLTCAHSCRLLLCPSHFCIFMHLLFDLHTNISSIVREIFDYCFHKFHTFTQTHTHTYTTHALTHWRAHASSDWLHYYCCYCVKLSCTPQPQRHITH
jgi:hypothetical protein